MARRNGLGRGLGALIPTEVTNRTSALREVPLAEVRANPFQPRKEFAEEALSALVDSIRAVGVLQPVLVRPAAEGGYELIAGERRCRAARRAGLQTIPALVQEVSDATSLEQALIENIQREQLNALDEAAAYQQLIEDFSFTHEDVARRVGRSRVAVTNALRLFQLPPSVQRLLRDERLSAGHARALLGTPDRDLQEVLARRAADEGLSVRALERLVRDLGGPAPEEVGPVPTEEELAASAWARNESEEALLAAAEGSPSSPFGVSPTTGEPWSMHGGGFEPASFEQDEELPNRSHTDVRGTGTWSGDPGDLDRLDPVRLVPSGEQADLDGPTVAGFGPGEMEEGASQVGGASGRPSALRPPGFLELEELLADHLNTRVRVEMSARHGRVVIDFATLEDLERIYRVMVEGRPF